MGGGADDGNFRRGAFKPIAILVAVVLVLGGGVAIFMGVKGEQAKVNPAQVAKEKKEIQLLPMAEQLPKWREWAKRDDERHASAAPACGMSSTGTAAISCPVAIPCSWARRSRS